MDFTLTDALQFKGIALSDVDAAEGESECHLWRGEMHALLTTVLEALDAA